MIQKEVDKFLKCDLHMHSSTDYSRNYSKDEFIKKANSYNKDISFLNNYVQDFINSFEKMISKLKKAGFNTFGLGLESIQSEENVNEIIKFPEFEIIDEKNSFWNIFKKKDFNDINKPFYDTFAYQKP